MPVFVSEECWTKYRQHPDSLCAVVERAGKTDSAHVVFLNWLGKYLSKQRSRNAEVWQAFEMANWAAYSHPILYRLYPILYRLLGRSWYVVRRATQRMHASTQRTRDPTSKNASVYEGCHDRTSCRKIRGWVRDLNQPDRPVKLDIYADDILLATVTADEFRRDLAVTSKGNGCHAFWHFVPPWLKDGRTHSIRVKVAGTNIDLRNSPRFINCELQIIKDIRFVGARLNRMQVQQGARLG